MRGPVSIKTHSLQIVKTIGVWMQLCELVSPESHRYAFLSPRSKMAIGEAFAYLFSLLYIVDLYNHKFLRYGTVTIESRIHTILITIVNLEFLEFG